MSWTCSECGAVWAPWFPGPCSHPKTTTDTTDTVPEFPGDRVRAHEHKYGDQDMTGTDSICLICGYSPPPSKTTIS